MKIYSTFFIMILTVFSYGFIIPTTQAYVNEWTDFVTNNFTGGTAIVTKNSTQWKIVLTGVTNGGVTIGSQYATPLTPQFLIPPWTIRYQVVSNTNNLCFLRPTSAATNGIPGSTGIALIPSTSTSTSFTFTQPSNVNPFGFTIYRNSGTATCEVNIFEITASDGTIIWNPSTPQPGDSGGGGNGSSTSISSTTISEGMGTTNNLLLAIAVIISLIASIKLSNQLLNRYYAV